MSDFAFIGIFVAVLVASAAGTRWLVRRLRRASSEVDQILAEAPVWDADAQEWATPHDVGPDPLRLLTELDAHLKAYGATVADFYDTTTGDR